MALARPRGSTPPQRILKHAGWKLFLQRTQRQAIAFERGAPYPHGPDEVRRSVHFEVMNDQSRLFIYLIAPAVGYEMSMDRL